MKREVHYCDVCGTEMTYVDSDGDMLIQSITIPSITADIRIRSYSGSSSYKAEMFGREFCGWHCFSSALSKFSDKVDSRTRTQLK